MQVISRAPFLGHEVFFSSATFSFKQFSTPRFWHGALSAQLPFAALTFLTFLRAFVSVPEFLQGVAFETSAVRLAYKYWCRNPVDSLLVWRAGILSPLRLPISPSRLLKINH
jgi:hypothetical protein